MNELPKRDLEKILHVEDDAGILEITGMALTIVDAFTVQQASCGADAVAMVEKFQPDLILIDVQMPGATGPETLDAIRKLPGLETVPAIFNTAKLIDGDDSDLDGPYNLGIIGKPFDPMTLGDEILALWHTRQALVG